MQGLETIETPRRESIKKKGKKKYIHSLELNTGLVNMHNHG